jgi:purine-binding chemotaxis protein CheW
MAQAEQKIGEHGTNGIYRNQRDTKGFRALSMGFRPFRSSRIAKGILCQETIMAQATETAAVLSGQSKAGKYLTFALSNEEYGLEILKVREINGYMQITAVPQTPAHIKGVINLRGQVIPVIDLRMKFGMSEAQVTEETCIIVVEINQGDRKYQTGIVVDRVKEVLDIAGENIEDAPQFGSSVDTNFILGMGKINGSVKILLDIDHVLGNEPFAALGN